MTEGHRYFLARLAQASDDELSAPSALPGWTGRHVLSHVGHNARAVGRLAHWAATGEPTPMYSGPSARAAEIALGARWDPDRLRSFVEVERDALAAAFEKLDAGHWATEVVTAQRRPRPVADRTRRGGHPGLRPVRPTHPRPLALSATSHHPELT